MKNVLVIAFDGLDYELIQRYDCKNIMQSNFGRINNDTNIQEKMTSELFASFITGKTHGEHGVTGLKKWTNPKINRLEEIVCKFPGSDKFAGLRKSLYQEINLFNAVNRKYKKQDLHCRTIFNEINNSKALFVPSYNPSWNWMCDAGQAPLKYGASRGETAKNWEKEFAWRKKRVFEEIENNLSLLMCHFHKPDIWQHLYAYDNKVRDEEKIRKLYEEIDNLSAEIKSQSRDKYDLLLFMSDHGLPTKDSHNENAFYSSNFELGLSAPHITDFYDIILSNTERDIEDGEFQGFRDIEI